MLRLTCVLVGEAGHVAVAIVVQDAVGYFPGYQNNGEHGEEDTRLRHNEQIL